MRILILGVNGFIGHSLARELLATTEHEIVGLDLVDDRVRPFLESHRFAFLQADMRDSAPWIEEQIRRCDVVLPLAAYPRPMEYVRDPLGVFELCFEENLRVVRLCMQYGVRLVFPSTSEVYGMGPPADLSEDSSPLVLGPVEKERWIYSCSKQLLERVIWASGRRGLRFTIIRPFNWFGPNLDDVSKTANGSSRVVTQFIGHALRGEPLQLVDGGGQRRTFTFIDDGIDALVRILRNDRDQAVGRIFNLGNPDNDVTIRELAEETVRAFAACPGFERLHETVRIESVRGLEYYGEGYQDAQTRRPDITNARKWLGWQPNVSLRSGLERLALHYTRHGVVTPPT